MSAVDMLIKNICLIYLIIIVEQKDGKFLLQKSEEILRCFSDEKKMQNHYELFRELYAI